SLDLPLDLGLDALVAAPLHNRLQHRLPAFGRLELVLRTGVELASVVVRDLLVPVGLGVDASRERGLDRVAAERRETEPGQVGRDALQTQSGGYLVQTLGLLAQNVVVVDAGRVD